MQMNVALNTTSHSMLLNSEFKRLADEIAQITNTKKLVTAAYHDPALRLFSALDEERKRASLAQINTYNNSLKSASADGLINEKQSLWTVLKTLGFRPKSDIFEMVHADEAVEAYDLGGIQFWRNLKFLEVCNYTIEEMFCLPWHERYDRNLDAAKMTEDVVKRILTGEITDTHNCDIYNVLVERHSAKKYAIDVHHKMVSPLFYEDNSVAGFIVISDVKILATMQSAMNNAPTAPTFI